MGAVSNELSPLVRAPGQDSELNKLLDLLDKLTVVYNAKKDASKTFIDPSIPGEKHTLSSVCWNETCRKQTPL